MRPPTGGQVRYLHTVYSLAQTLELLRSTDIAKALGVTNVSAHNMLKRLADQGLIQKEYRGTVTLTQEGISAAAKIHGNFKALYRLFHQSLGQAPADASACAYLLLCDLSSERLSKLVTAAR